MTDANNGTPKPGDRNRIAPPDTVEALSDRWSDISKTLRECSNLVASNQELSKSLDWMADAFCQCSQELDAALRIEG